MISGGKIEVLFKRIIIGYGRESMKIVKSNDGKIEIVYCAFVDTFFPRHTHIFHYVIGYVIDGTIRIETDDEKRLCNANQYFCIRPNVAHKISSVTDVYSLVSICIDEDYLIEDDLDNILSKLLKMCDGIIDRNQSDINEEVIETAIISLESMVTGIINKYDDVFNELAEKLVNNPENPFSIDNMSNMVCISSYYLVHRFKEKMGLSPHQFQIQSRIRKAKLLLEDGMNVVDVAANTGFCDQSHFDKCFKKLVGIRPNEYKVEQE